MSKIVSLYHIVLCVKHRVPSITKEYLEDLYRFIWSIVVLQRSKLIRIGGREDHVHMLVDLSPRVSLLHFIAKVKTQSCDWLVADNRYPYFERWGKGFYAATVSHRDVNALVNYIKNQREHHLTLSLEDELIRLCSGVGLTYIQDDLAE